MPLRCSPPRSSDDGTSADPPALTARRIGNLVRVSGWTFFPLLAVAGLALLLSTLGERWQHTRDSTRGEP